MMYVIYGFSAQDGNVSGNLSYQVSYKIVEIGNEILDKGLDETQIADYADQIGYPVRKLAHMTEYFLLAVAVSCLAAIPGCAAVNLTLSGILGCPVLDRWDLLSFLVLIALSALFFLLDLRAR